jgi:hypothetical protein
MPQVAEALDLPFTTRNVRPLSPNDSGGLPLFCLVFGIVLASFLFSVASFTIASSLPRLGHWTGAILLAIGLGVTATLIARFVTHTIEGGAGIVALLATLASLGRQFRDLPVPGRIKGRGQHPRHRHCHRHHLRLRRPWQRLRRTAAWAIPSRLAGPAAPRPADGCGIYRDPRPRLLRREPYAGRRCRADHLGNRSNLPGGDRDAATPHVVMGAAVPVRSGIGFRNDEASR